ncbi:MAG: tetratricopeptide repeat protein [Elusimicrobia bacterium]|nr:tetratricopeptide repeat protein [Elusimicrobiota bacterium]
MNLVHTTQKPLYTALRYAVNNAGCFPLFTDKRLIAPPFTAQNTAAFLETVFNVPDAQIIAFNPSIPQKNYECPEIRLDKKRLSIIIGRLKSPVVGIASDTCGRSAAVPAAGVQNTADSTFIREMELGDLHKAHYYAYILETQGQIHSIRYYYPQLLIELNLYQEAYGFLKTILEKEPANEYAFYFAALLYQRNRNPQKAMEWLNKIPEGSPLDVKKSLLTAHLMLDLNEPAKAENIFRNFIEHPYEKQSAFNGLGMTLLRMESQEKKREKLEAAINAFNRSLQAPGYLNAKTFFYLGNAHFRGGNYAKAEESYAKSLYKKLSTPAVINMAFAMMKNNKMTQAAELYRETAITEPEMAVKIMAEIPNSVLEKIPAEFSRITLQENAQYQTVFQMKPKPKPPLTPAKAKTEASLEPAAISDRKMPPETIKQEESVKIETFGEVFSGWAVKEKETAQDAFISRAFKMATSLEDEFGKKIYFNINGIAEIEKKLRMTFLKSKITPQASLEIVLDCSSFLCYYFQERHKAKLIKLLDFDPWAWPMTITLEDFTMPTYPIQRVWKLLWDEKLPEPGWLINYVHYVENELEKRRSPLISGIQAVRAKTRSHHEKITDAEAEHKKTMIFVSSIDETRNIEIARTGVKKIEELLKSRYHPETPPDPDGWRLLRCCGHVFAEIIQKDFKGFWYNTNGNDGSWTMQMPWQTFIFPIGKIYKAASNKESLTEYYDVLLSEKLKFS